MFEFVKFYGYTHTIFLWSFVTSELSPSEQITRHIFPIFYFLLNLSWVFKAGLVARHVGMPPAGTPLRERMWRGYVDVLLLDVIQAYCFWQYFETSKWGEWVPVMHHMYGLSPVITLLLLMVYQAITLCQPRNTQEDLFGMFCRLFIMWVSCAGVVITGLKAFHILTGNDALLLFKR